MNLSIIIVTYNSNEFLKECLQSLHNKTNDEIEVFVVDNNSFDGSPELVESEFPWVKLIRNKKNLGFAAANNQAIKQCKGRYIMLLNSDTVMLDGSVEKILTFMDQYEKAGIVGCKLLNTDGTLQPSVTSFPNVLKDTVAISLKGSVLQNTPLARALISKIGKIFSFSASRFDDHSKTKEIDFPRGACFTIRRKVIDEIGLLDDNYFFTGEEMDFAYRAKQKDWKIFYYPEAAVIHHDHGATKQIMGKVFVQTRKGALRFYQKHYGWFHTEAMKLLVSSVLLFKCITISLHLLFPVSKRKQLLAQKESYWILIKVHYNSNFRKLNVFSEMTFHYN